MLEKHGCRVKKLKSELYYSSTLCLVVFQVLHSANLWHMNQRLFKDSFKAVGELKVIMQCTRVHTHTSQTLHVTDKLVWLVRPSLTTPKSGEEGAV